VFSACVLAIRLAGHCGEVLPYVLVHQAKAGALNQRVQALVRVLQEVRSRAARGCKCCCIAHARCCTVVCVRGALVEILCCVLLGRAWLACILAQVHRCRACCAWRAKRPQAVACRITVVMLLLSWCRAGSAASGICFGGSQRLLRHLQVYMHYNTRVLAYAAGDTAAQYVLRIVDNVFVCLRVGAALPRCPAAPLPQQHCHCLCSQPAGSTYTSGLGQHLLQSTIIIICQAQQPSCTMACPRQA
jgi:hypothetical protein